MLADHFLAQGGLGDRRLAADVLPLLSGSPSVLIPTMDFMREPVLWLWAVHHYRGALSWAPNFAYSVCAKRVSDEDIEALVAYMESLR